MDSPGERCLIQLVEQTGCPFTPHEQRAIQQVENNSQGSSDIACSNDDLLKFLIHNEAQMMWWSNNHEIFRQGGLNSQSAPALADCRMFQENADAVARTILRDHPLLEWVIIRGHFEDMVPQPRHKSQARMESFRPELIRDAYVLNKETAFFGPEALVAEYFWVVGKDTDDGIIYHTLATNIDHEVPLRNFTRIEKITHVREIHVLQLCYRSALTPHLHVFCRPIAHMQNMHFPAVEKQGQTSLIHTSQTRAKPCTKKSEKR
jgi:hypothetical protein